MRIPSFQRELRTTVSGDMQSRRRLELLPIALRVSNIIWNSKADYVIHSRRDIVIILL